MSQVVRGNRAAISKNVSNSAAPHGARWYATKTHPSYREMLIKLRRVLIAAEYRADPQVDPTPEQIQGQPHGLG